MGRTGRWVTRHWYESRPRDWTHRCACAQLVSDSKHGRGASVFKEVGACIKNQRRAEGVNEVRRIAGFLERNQARASRILYLGEKQKEMLKSLGLEGVPE